MEYKGKLYGKVHKSYFPLEATTEDWDALKNRITQLEAENQTLRQPPVVGQSEQLKAFVDWWHNLSQEELAWHEGRYVEVFESI